MFGLASYKKSTVRNAHPFLGSLQKGSGSEIQMYFSWNHSRVRVLFLVCNFFWFGSILGPYGEKNSPPTFDLNFFHWITIFWGLFMDRNQGLFFQNPMIWIPGILGIFFLF